jgi:hypothetical protein
VSPSRKARFAGLKALRYILRLRAWKRRVPVPRFLAITKSLERAHLMPLREGRIYVCNLLPLLAQLLIPSSEKVVTERGQQATTAEPTIFAHAGRRHQIPNDQGESSSMAYPHACHLAEATGKPKDIACGNTLGFAVRDFNLKNPERVGQGWERRRGRMASGGASAPKFRDWTGNA